MNENPSVSDFLKNTQALRIVNGVCKDVVRLGNCRGQKRQDSPLKSSTLPKRQQRHESGSVAEVGGRVFGIFVR